MKKIMVLILLILFCIICLSNKKDNISLVFNENDYNYKIYDLDLSKDNITTNNLDSYFQGYTVIGIKPNINPIYKKIINIKEYDFDTTETIDNNIDSFNEIYINLLKENNLNSEIDNYYYHGLKIDEITLYITNTELNTILMNKNIEVIK